MGNSRNISLLTAVRNDADTNCWHLGAKIGFWGFCSCKCDLVFKLDPKRNLRFAWRFDVMNVKTDRAVRAWRWTEKQLGKKEPLIAHFTHSSSESHRAEYCQFWHRQCLPDVINYTKFGIGILKSVRFAEEVNFGQSQHEKQVILTSVLARLSANPITTTLISYAVAFRNSVAQHMPLCRTILLWRQIIKMYQFFGWSRGPAVNQCRFAEADKLKTHGIVTS